MDSRKPERFAKKKHKEDFVKQKASHHGHS